MDATNKAVPNASLTAEALAVFDLMLVGCVVPEFGGYENGDGEVIGPRMDALHAALRAAATQPQPAAVSAPSDEEKELRGTLTGGKPGPLAWVRLQYPNDPTTNSATAEAWKESGWSVVALDVARAAAPVSGPTKATLGDVWASGGVHWDLFPGYLIDHCERNTITEEGLQFALADMLKDPDYLRIAAERSSSAPVSGQGATLPPLPERDGDWAGDDWFTANSMEVYGQLCIDSRRFLANSNVPDGYIAVAMIGSEYTSVAFKNIETARAMCVKGGVTPFWTSALASTPPKADNE